MVVIQGADGPALLISSVSPGVKGPSFSVCRAVKWFWKGTSGFRGRLFLLLVLAVASIPLCYWTPSHLYVPVREFLAVGPLQAVLGIS